MPINEGAGPAVYVAADHYLCSQVRDEAAQLGLTVTDDPRSPDFQTGKAILVIPIHTLLNGLFKFRVGRDIQIEIGSIVIDDAHACLAIAEQQFTLSLPRAHPAFAKLLTLFSEDLRSQSIAGTVEIERGDPRGLVQVPYWAWMDKHERVIAALADHQDDQDLRFVWPLLKADLHLCRCFFTATTAEISPPCLPVDVIPSFAEARRRIYMTATLSDDSVLITDFGANPESLPRPITPKTASDLGDRMILVPQRINTGIKDDAVKAFISGASSINVAVIVPSGERARFWSDVATRAARQRSRRWSPPDVRRRTRLERAAPVIEALRIALYDALRRLSPKSEVAKAIAYGRKCWIALTRFVEDGRLEIDNNIAERAMRSIAIGQKNWLFAGSKAGGERTTAIYTVIETCKLNRVEPQAYIADVIAKIADNWPAARWNELMPWNWLPDFEGIAEAA